jgi:Aminoglycoside-2''-adenylyltransferase
MNIFPEPQEVARILNGAQCDWGVAGGWAIDLFLNRITRQHQDIEVAIFRQDQLILQRHLLSRGWSLECVRMGQLEPWSADDYLALPVHEIWCRTPSGPLQHVEVLLNEREADQFVFRRDSRIRSPINSAFIRSTGGIRILAPEIVLLYKSKRPEEPKEQQDFLNAVAALEIRQRQWLLGSLSTIDPEHRWLAGLRNHKPEQVMQVTIRPATPADTTA